jgi:stalled ribosome rescue protein Dom34
MSQVAVWIDHQKAFIFNYLKDGIQKKELEPYDSVKGNSEHLRKFYHQVADSLKNAEAILLLGPGQAKEEFKNHCEKHHSQVNKAIKKIADMKDHPTQSEILKISNTFFKEFHSFKGF